MVHFATFGKIETDRLDFLKKEKNTEELFNYLQSDAYSDAESILKRTNKEGNKFKQYFWNHIKGLFKGKNWKFAFKTMWKDIKSKKESGFKKQAAYVSGGALELLWDMCTLMLQTPLNMAFPDASMSPCRINFFKYLNIAEAKRRDDTFDHPFINDFYGPPKEKQTENI